MSGNSRAKRQFAGAASDPAQRQITSFFNKASSGGNASRTLPEDVATGPLQGPILPHHIQSSLINVGMRVRKSVPEGYKTGGGGGIYPTFSLWSESSSDLKPTPSAPLPARQTSAMRELTPFCGINKVGGLAVQPSPDLDDMPGLTSSQDSLASTASTASRPTPHPSNRKRLFITDEEYNDDCETTEEAGAAHGGPWLKIDDWLDGEMSPRSLAPVGWENARVMAVPKRRGAHKPQVSNGAAVVLAGLGQENMAVDDFEEAPFLDYGLGGDEMMELE
ncbi:ribonucleotide reductase inhibitor-domain-containing protein [Cercophora scortea]|uniref:Ribonucleotide reductase inhibitor-domain-containing protein n=1 Tax=Cercophora scortea TaxID=314031 RepID=A0AAE0MKG2_9PEZI|nr:ribonucleotide reductase inhibitor-domain-containing protein [Cercophora scortea]